MTTYNRTENKQNCTNSGDYQAVNWRINWEHSSLNLLCNKCNTNAERIMIVKSSHSTLVAHNTTSVVCPTWHAKPSHQNTWLHCARSTLYRPVTLSRQLLWRGACAVASPLFSSHLVWPRVESYGIFVARESLSSPTDGATACRKTLFRSSSASSRKLRLAAVLSAERN